MTPLALPTRILSSVLSRLSLAPQHNPNDPRQSTGADAEADASPLALAKDPLWDVEVLSVPVPAKHAALSPPTLAFSDPAGPSSFGPEAERRRRDLLNRLKEDLTCGICFNLMVRSHGMRCGHVFCGPCLGTHLKINKFCPMCRTITSLSDMYPIFTLNSSTDSYASLYLSKDEIAERDARKKEFQDWKKPEPPSRILPPSSPIPIPGASQASWQNLLASWLEFLPAHHPTIFPLEFRPLPETPGTEQTPPLPSRLGRRRAIAPGDEDHAAILRMSMTPSIFDRLMEASGGV